MDLRKVEAEEEIGTLRSGGGGGGEVEAWKTLGAHMYPPWTAPAGAHSLSRRDQPRSKRGHVAGVGANRRRVIISRGHHAIDFNFPFQTLPPGVITRIYIDNEGIIE